MFISHGEREYLLLLIQLQFNHLKRSEQTILV